MDMSFEAKIQDHEQNIRWYTEKNDKFLQSIDSINESIEYFEKEIRDPSCDPVMKEKYKKIVKELKANRSNFLEYVNDYEESLAKEQALLNELMAQRKGSKLTKMDRSIEAQIRDHEENIRWYTEKIDKFLRSIDSINKSIEYFENEIRDPSCDPVMKEKYKKIVKELNANRSNFIGYMNDYEESLAKEQAILNELMAQREGGD